MTTIVKLEPDRATFNGGKFDTDNRYLRETSGAHLTTLLAGPSLALQVHNSGSFSFSIAWRFKVGAYNVTGEQPGGSYPPPVNVSNTPTNIVL